MTEAIRLRDHLGAWPVIISGWLLAHIPHRLALRFGAGIGWLSYRLLRSRRLVAQTNIAACFPKLNATQQHDLVRQTFHENGMGLIDTAIAWWGSDRRLEGIASITGQEHLEQAYALGNGVIVLIAHYPSLELGGRLLNRGQSQPIFGMARQHNNPCLNAAFDRGRRRHCETTFSKGEALGLMRALKNNRAVFYAADQNFNHGFVFAPLFGVPAACVTALSDLTRRSAAAVVPMWCHRQANGHYQITLQAAWQRYPSDNPEQDARRMNQWIEEQLSQQPAQYLWLHRRFKNQPDGTEPFYPSAARRAKHQ